MIALTLLFDQMMLSVDLDARFVKRQFENAKPRLNLQYQVAVLHITLA